MDGQKRLDRFRSNIFRQTDRQTDKQANMHTDGRTDKRQISLDRFRV